MYAIGDHARNQAKSSGNAFSYAQKRPENTYFYKIVASQMGSFFEPGRFEFPKNVLNEFEAYQKCCVLEHGFIRQKCDDCKFERVLGLSCKKRGFCPQCCSRRMVETGAFLVDHVIPDVKMRQWVLSLPMPIRYRMANSPELTSKVLTIYLRCVSSFLKNRARQNFGKRKYETGAITVIQRHGSALNLNTHFHVLFMDGCFSFEKVSNGQKTTEHAKFHKLSSPTNIEVKELLDRIVDKVLKLFERSGFVIIRKGELISNTDTENNDLVNVECQHD